MYNWDHADLEGKQFSPSIEWVNILSLEANNTRIDASDVFSSRAVYFEAIHDRKVRDFTAT